MIHKVIQRLARLRDLAPGLESFAASLSGEDPGYLDVCRRAAVDDRTFAVFRRNPAYTAILEHVSDAQGRSYLAAIRADSRARRGLEEAARNDRIGGPVTMRLDSGVNISPTTLRYLKVADDLEQAFGSLDGADVVEIGIGYGGLCRVVDALFAIRSYTLLDLRPVLGLADRFLGCFPLRCAVRFATMNELTPTRFDLAISNYALTECERAVQEVYFRKALRDTPQGYITFNDLAPPQYDTVSAEEWCRRLAARVVPEVPLTHPGNKILVWGGSSEAPVPAAAT